MGLTAEILGPVRLLHDGVPLDLGGPRQRRLFAALVVERGSGVPTERLIETVFEGQPPRSAQRTFRTYIARLRRALNDAGIDASRVVLTEPRGYRVPTDALGLDSTEFESGLADARDRLDAGDPAGATVAVEHALALWSGPAFGEFCDEGWARVEAARLNSLRTVARELLSEAALESGRHATAIPDLERLIEEEPFREEPRRLLMLALYRSGRHADALRAGRTYRSFLVEESGLDPSRQLNELEQLIIDQDPRLDARPFGRKLRGYVLHAPIGESEIGTTYRATQPSIGRDVAITAISSERADDPSFVHRFEVHAQRIASIEHLNVVPLYDYWREPGAAYLVTRFLSGGTLEDRLVRGSLTSAERLEILHQIGGALTAAHERGVVHGRFQATRVLFDEAGVAYVIGFGLDVESCSTSTDVEALVLLVDELWRDDEQYSDPIGALTTTVASTSVATTDRPAMADDRSFATIADVVAAVQVATGGDTRRRLGPPQPAVEGANPYRGLFAFDETDADVFFGRERFIDEMVADLATHPFLAVLGPSGSGKSSVVRAGLLPRLRADGMFVTSMVPGERPIAELEVALARVAATPIPPLTQTFRDDPDSLNAVLADVLPDISHDLALVIDQFEEAFTLADVDERDLLLDTLVRALDDPDNRLVVIITARADFLGPILDHPTIGAAVRDHSRLVTPLEPEELHRAIVGPAAAAGVSVDAALEASLVGDVTRSPGSLPLLQYALTELYEHRVDRCMTPDAYRRLGGIGAMLSRRAEEIYAVLDANEREASRRLFSRLITPGDGTEDTRRRARLAELVGVPRTVLDTYAAARLLSFDRDPITREPTVEIAHESLVRRWPRLREWINEDRDGVRLLTRLTAAASEWQAVGRDDAELYRDARLEAAQEWAAEHPDELSPAESDFLDASLAQRDAELGLERQRLRRLRALLMSVAVVAVIALVAGLIALVQRGQATRLADEADLRRLMAEAQSAASDDPNRALLLAVEAYEREPSNETLGAVQAAVVATPWGWQGDIANGRAYRRVAYLGDGTLVAAGERAIEVWNPVDRRMLRDRPVDGTVTDIDVDRDSGLIGVAAADGSWTLLDADDLESVSGGRADTGITVIRIFEQHDLAALGLDDGRVQLVSLSGPLRRQFLEPAVVDLPIEAGVVDVSLSPDGRSLAAALGWGHVAQQWDLTVDDPLAEPLATDEFATMVLYADDSLYAAGSVLQAFDPTTGEPTGSPRDVPEVVETHGRMTSSGPGIEITGLGIYAGYPADGSEATGQILESYQDVLGGAVSPDGSTVVHATHDGLTFWSLDGSGAFVDAVIPPAEKGSVLHSITTDGRMVVQGGNIFNDVDTTIWSIEDSTPTLVTRLARGFGARQFANDVFSVARTDSGLTFRLWDEATGAFDPVMTTTVETQGSNSPAFTPDRKYFVHPWNDGSGRVDVYDAATGNLLHRLDDIADAAPSMTSWPSVPAYSTDGSQLVYATTSDFVAVYDIASWTLVDLLDPSIGFSDVAFTPDGERAITLSRQGLEVRDAADLRTILMGPVPTHDEASLGRILEVTSDGRYLKYGGLHGGQLWDATTLEPIGVPFPHDEEVWTSTLAADTNQLATVVDGSTVIWDVDLDSWPGRACLLAGRNLTQEEWEQFGPRGDYRATCDQWGPAS